MRAGAAAVKGQISGKILRIHAPSLHLVDLLPVIVNALPAGCDLHAAEEQIERERIPGILRVIGLSLIHI